MRPDAEEVLRNAFKRLIEREVSPEQKQDFIDRSRRYHEGEPELQVVLDELEQQIPKGE